MELGINGFHRFGNLRDFFFVIPIVHCAFNPQVHKTVLPTSTEKRDKMSIIQVVLERF